MNDVQIVVMLTVIGLVFLCWHAVEGKQFCQLYAGADGERSSTTG